MRDIVEIYEHWQARRGIKAIARSLGLDPKTVRRYVRAAEAAGLRRDQPVSREQWAAFVRERFPTVGDPLQRSTLFAELDRYREAIREGLQTNRMSTVRQRLEEATGLRVSPSTFRRYVHRVLPEALKRPVVTVWRPEVPPGEEGQVDFGFMDRWLDPVSRQVRRVYAFILVLSYSRHLFVRFVTRLDGPTWLRCHLEALAFLDGAPRRIVLDNLKDGVVKPDLYDPQLNRAYAEFAAYHGILLDPARSGRPRDKARVERAIPYVRESLWRGRTFLSEEAMNREAVRWCREVAGMRVHGTTRRRPLEAFEAEERPHLQSLPPVPWEPCTWTTAKVGPDAHGAVAGHLYSVPHILRGERLDVRYTDRLVEFYRNGTLVKTHLRGKGRGRTTDPADLPPDKVAFYERTPQWCLRRAREVGPAVFEAVRQVLAENTLTHLRQAQGILRLSETYGPARLDAACRRALAFGDPRYRTVKTILQSGLDRQAVPEDRPTGAVGAYLRGVGAFTLTTGKED